jgi:hypothetical protein
MDVATKTITSRRIQDRLDRIDRRLGRVISRVNLRSARILGPDPRIEALRAKRHLTQAKLSALKDAHGRDQYVLIRELWELCNEMEDTLTAWLPG